MTATSFKMSVSLNKLFTADKPENGLFFLPFFASFFRKKLTHFHSLTPKKPENPKKMVTHAGDRHPAPFE